MYGVAQTRIFVAVIYSRLRMATVADETSRSRSSQNNRYHENLVEQYKI